MKEDEQECDYVTEEENHKGLCSVYCMDSFLLL